MNNIYFPFNPALILIAMSLSCAQNRMSPPANTAPVSGSNRESRATVNEVNLVCGKPLVLHAGDDLIASIAFTPDGKQLVSVGWDHTVRLWDLSTAKEIGRFIGHTDDVIHVAISPDGKWVATSAQDNTIRLWDIKTQREIHRFQAETLRGGGVAFSPDGHRLAGADFKGAHIWNLTNYQQVLWLRASDGCLTDICFSEDGKRIAAVVNSGGANASNTTVWEASSGEMVACFPNPSVQDPNGSGTMQLEIWTADLSPDANLLATSGQDAVRIWQIDDHKLVKDIKQGSKALAEKGDFGLTVGFCATRFSHSGRFLLAAGANNALYIWEVGTWRALARLHGRHVWNPFGTTFGANYFTDGEFSKDESEVAASCTDGNIWVWQLAIKNSDDAKSNRAK